MGLGLARQFSQALVSYLEVCLLGKVNAKQQAHLPFVFCERLNPERSNSGLKYAVKDTYQRRQRQDETHKFLSICDVGFRSFRGTWNGHRFFFSQKRAYRVFFENPRLYLRSSRIEYQSVKVYIETNDLNLTSISFQISFT